MEADEITVEVACGNSVRQELVALRVERGTSAIEAVLKSGIPDLFPEIDMASAKIGIFGEVVALDTVLEEGDRVEIYRKLVMDPREARRRRANKE